MLQRAFESGSGLSGLYCGEALSALDGFPSEYFDLVIADPPYNLGHDFGNNSDAQPEESYERWMREWIAKLARPTKPHGSVYLCCDWRHSALCQSALQSSGFAVLNRITWKRDKGRGAQRNWKQNMEDIWFAVRDKKQYTFNLDQVMVRKKVIAPYRENGLPKDWQQTESGERTRLTHPSNIWTDLTVPFWSMAENTEHPTQKPERLIERIVLASSNPGDRILDLFSGSGTTSVVAKRLGRDYLGVEINPDFVRLGLARLRRVGESKPELKTASSEL